MKRNVVLALLIVLTGCSSLKDTKPTPDCRTLKIGSFNIEQFGPTKVSRTNTLTVLAKIATTFDVLAIQELDSSNLALDAYVSKINELAGSDSYAKVRGNQYAIIYRKSSVELKSHILYTGSESFTYPPLIAYLSSIAGNFDFAMIVIHTSPSSAEIEIPALKTVIAEVAKDYNEPDVICLGDFNADGGYFKHDSGTELYGFDAFITVIPNTADTTVADSSNAYDRIQLTKSMTSDYTTFSGVIPLGLVYDVTACEGTDTTAGTESALSDHYPVWAEFFVDRDED